jgi:hypothetical protein
LIGVTEVIERIFAVSVEEVRSAGFAEGAADRVRYAEVGRTLTREGVRRRAESFANALGAYGEEPELTEKRAAYIAAFHAGWAA